MHENELPIDEALVRRLVDEQFPEWADLPLRRVEPWGTVNAIFRLGDELSVRLPRLASWSDEEHRVAQWLPRLAPVLPLAVPEPVARGAPAEGYPCHWSVCTWIDGETGVDARWEPVAAAETLAAFVAALRTVDATGTPPSGDRLAHRGDDMRASVAQLGGRATEVWEAALAAPSWDGPPVLCHADLDARNWLVRGGRITGIIDWEGIGVRDPAADVMVAWKLHSAQATSVFRDRLGVDDATWARARGWAIAQAASALGYYTMENNAPLVVEARRWVELVLAD
jgi:aminoglycoside phosphotransferase (APT) family kinase protein